MRKIWVKILVVSLMTFGIVIPTATTPSANAGISTLTYCGITFNRDISIQPTTPAFTYELKYALSYDTANRTNTTASNVQFPNAYGGVVLSPHTTLLGSADTTGGLEVFYNTSYLPGGRLLIFMGKGSGKFTYFTNPSWELPDFTEAQGSSPYIHVAVVRDASNRLTVFFNGVGPTSYYQTQGEGGGTYIAGNYTTDPNVYTSSRYFGASGRFTTDTNPKQYLSNIRLVTGSALYNPVSTSISVPSIADLRLNAPTGTTELLLNSLSPSGIVANSSNSNSTAAALYNFAGGSQAQIDAGQACPANASLMYVGGEGVYNVYFAEGNSASTSGTLPTRTYYDSTASPLVPITVPAIGTLAKTGGTYSFGGWNTAADGSGTTYAPGSSFTPTGNTTLYTKWIAAYTVTYSKGTANGSEAAPTQAAVASGGTFLVAANPFTKTTSIFTGWSDGTSTYQPGDTYTMGSANKTLTAQWTTGYKATYNANSATSGTVPTTQQYASPSGTALTISSNTGNLQRTGYTFAGWNTASNGSLVDYAEGQTSVTLSADIILYAKWTANTNVVTYDAQGGTSVTSGSVTTGATLTLPSAPSRAGYAFRGWFVAATGGTALVSGYTPTNTSAFTLYSQWNANTNTVTYNPQGGAAVTSGSVATGSTLALPSAPSRSGYTFNGWFEAATGGTALVSGYTPTNTAAFTLYAQWSGITYTITYLANSATSGTAPTAQSYTTGGTAITLDDNSTAPLVRTGYNFVGWNTLANGLGTNYATGATAQTFTAATNLYAKWSGISNTVSYDSQGGTSVTSGSVATGSALTLPAAPTRAGYAFAGWFVAATGGTALVSGYTPANTSAFTLYAQWTANTFNVTFNSQGGSAVSPVSFSTGSTLALPAEPTRPGYTFNGWFVAASGGSALVTGYSPTNTSAFTLHAQWTANANTVTYDTQGGSSVSNEPFSTGSALTLPAAPTRAGYTFAGWFTAATGGTALVSGYTPTNTSGFTLYAHWTANVNPVTYDSQGGTTVINATFVTGTTLTLRPAPTRVGYTFAGWFAAPTGGTALVSGYSPTNTSAFTIYAQWTGNANTVTYDSQGGSAVSSASFSTGSALTLPTTSTRAGYTFAGWFEGATGGTALISGYTPINTSGFTLYAQWTPNSNVVTFDSQGGSAVVDGSFTTATTLTLPSSPTRAGYTFNGWFAAATGGTSLVSGYSPTNTFAFTLYAQWTGITYTISYLANSATSGTAPTSQSFTTGGTPLTLASSAGLLKTGFFFAGWNTLADGYGTDYIDGATGQTFATDLTLYAKWTTSPTRTVTFKANGGVGSDTTQSTNVETNLVSNTFTRPGFIFSGWNSAADGTGSDVANNANYAFATNLILFAKWTAKTSRTLSFAATAVNKKYGETLSANAALSLGIGTITYSRGSSTACSINTSTGLITITNSAGTCVITASSTEDATYQAVESTVSLVVTVSLGLPAVPTLGTIASVDGVLKVAFTQSDAVGNAITDYKYSIDGINFISVGNTTSPLSIPGLTPGTYTLQIIAVNAFGESSPTAPVVVIVIAGPTVTVTAPATGGRIVYVPTGPSASEIAADQRAAVEKALAEKAAADKVIADKLAAEKAAADKLAAEKAVADKVIADKLAAEKAAADKLVADKAAADKVAADKIIADKLAADKAAADKIIADKLAADNSAAAAQFKSTCNLAQGSTAVIPKSSTMKIYSQICFVPDSMKPINSDLLQVKKLVQQLKSKNIKSVTLSSFADEKNGVNFKMIAQSRAEAVASMIMKANPKMKITYRLYGSSTKKNSLSLGRVVITA